MRPFQTIYQIIKFWSEKTPGATAIEALDRLPLTYADLFGYINYIGRELRSLGLERNDRVAIIMDNGPEVAAFFLAVSSYAACAPLNHGYKYKEFKNYLPELKTKIIFIKQDTGPTVIPEDKFLNMQVMELSPLPKGKAGICEIKKSNKALEQDPGIYQKSISEDDIALVLLTSGTTSRPKIVPLSQRNICASANNIRRSLNLSPQDKCLNIMPFYHVHALMITIAALSAGGSVVCPPSFDKNKFFNWTDKFNPTWYTALPTIHQAILSQAGSNRELAGKCKLRFIRSSAGHLHAKTRVQLEKFFKAPVIESYGMTESALQISSNSPPPEKHKPGSTGRAHGVEVVITDKKGKPVKAGKIGEIVVRGKNIIDNYENDPESNKKSFINGWLKTGDLGYFDNEGYLYVVGRIKEVINRGGEKISPAEVEEVLLRYPKVNRAVVSSMPHPTLGEEVIAAVVIANGKATPEHEIRAFVARELAEFKVPKRIFFVDKLPQNSTGKLQRVGLYKKLKDYKASIHSKPGSKAENILKEILCKVLKVEKISIDDNFFELGGDSLRLTEFYKEIKIHFPDIFKVQDLFDNLTIRELANFIKKKKEINSAKQRRIKKIKL